tara:strand:+ start:7384 stop:9939 length:2556 start_codon:yes stop_codon:yes gene_type:complete
MAETNLQQEEQQVNRDLAIEQDEKKKDELKRRLKSAGWLKDRQGLWRRPGRREKPERRRQPKSTKAPAGPLPKDPPKRVERRIHLPQPPPSRPPEVREQSIELPTEELRRPPRRPSLSELLAPNADLVRHENVRDLADPSRERSPEPPPPPPVARDLERDPIVFGDDRTPVQRLVDDLSGQWGEGAAAARRTLGEEDLERQERQNAAIDARIEVDKAREKRDELERARRMRLREAHHQQNLRTLEERGAEQDPARARDFLNRESGRLGLPSLRTPEERKIAHGTYSPSDPTGLEGRMLGLGPVEAEPRRLTARERSQLAQGVADDDLVAFADETGQFDRSRVGFATPGTVTDRGVRYEESDENPGAVRVVGPQRARLEDLLSEAEYAESVEGDRAGAAALRGEAEGIQAEIDARRAGGREAARRSRNARSLTQALVQRERGRPGDVEVDPGEQSLIDAMTPAQRDRLTVQRARARGRGFRDRDRREARRQAWNAEALRRDPSLADSIGGKPMTAFQRASLDLQRDDLADKRSARAIDREEASNRFWREDRRSLEREAEARRRGDLEQAEREREHRERLRRWEIEDRRHEEEIDRRNRERREDREERGQVRKEDKAESAEARKAQREKEDRDLKIANERSIIDSQGSSTAAKAAARERLDKLINPPEPLEDTLSPGTGPAGTSPATTAPAAAAVPEGYEDDRGYAQQEAAMSVMETDPAMPQPEREALALRQSLVGKLRKKPKDEQDLLKDLYSDRWKGGIFADATTFAEWAASQYSGYSIEELKEFYRMEAPKGSENTDDWHVGSREENRPSGGFEDYRKRRRPGAHWVPPSKAARAGISADDPEWVYTGP